MWGNIHVESTVYTNVNSESKDNRYTGHRSLKSKESNRTEGGRIRGWHGRHGPYPKSISRLKLDRTCFEGNGATSEARKLKKI
jgi:hypothetical protein